MQERKTPGGSAVVSPSFVLSLSPSPVASLPHCESEPAATTGGGAAAWQLHVVRDLPARAKPSLLRTHIDTLSQCAGTESDADAMWTISRLSFVEFVSEEMKRPGRLMCADQESVIWEMLGNKPSAKKHPAVDVLAPAASSTTGAAAAAGATPSRGLSSAAETNFSDPTAGADMTRIHLHPAAISRWIAKYGSLSWECSPLEDEQARLAFFWILTALLHNRHNYDLQERSKHAAAAATSPSPSPKSPSSNATTAAAVTSTSNAYSNAARRRYEVEHAPRPILFPKDDPTGAQRATFVQQRVALLQKTLLPHQVREITWMVSLERMIGRDPNRRTSWTKLSTQDCHLAGLPSTYYVHSNARVAELRIDSSAPAPRQITVAGGALGSETGLGKTISLLALVWLEAEGSALRWIDEDEKCIPDNSELEQMEIVDEEGDTVMAEDVQRKPKVKVSAKLTTVISEVDAEAAAETAPKPSKTVRTKATKVDAAVVSDPPRRSTRATRSSAISAPVATAATKSKATTTKAGGITKKVTKKSRTTKVLEDEPEEDEDDNVSVAISVASKVSKASASTKGRAKAAKKPHADDDVEELDTYVPSSHPQRVKATLLVSPNQTFMQHVTKARTTLPPSCSIVAIADKAQYMRTTAADIRHADLVIISTEFFSNALLREVMDYDRELLAESDVKRARRLGQPPSKKARAVKRRWHFHQFDWFRLVLDEAHEVGSPLSSKHSYATPILNLSSCFRWYVSATFPHGSPDELRFAMQFLQLRVDGELISDLEGEYRGTTLKEAFVPSMEDICIPASSPIPAHGKLMSLGMVDGQPIRAAPVSYGRASFMLTATAAALRQLLYRDLYFRSTKARVRQENPRMNLFQPLRRQVIIARTNALERLRQYWGHRQPKSLPFGYTNSEPGDMTNLLNLFPSPHEWQYGGAALFFVQKLIHSVVEYLRLLSHDTLEVGTRHLRVAYSPCVYQDIPARVIRDKSSAEIRLSNERKVADGIHWSPSRLAPCPKCHRYQCDDESIDVFPDFSWTAMWLDPVPVPPGVNATQSVWRTVCSEDFESHRDMDETLAKSQPLRRTSNHWLGMSDVVGAVRQKTQEVEDLKDLLRSPYPLTPEQLTKLDSVMKREISDAAERDAMASCVRMVSTGGNFVPPAWVEPLMDHFVQAPAASHPLAELATEYFVCGGEAAPSMTRWAAQQSSLVVAALLEIHRILHEDWGNHRIVLFATHTVDLASVLRWLALLMPQVSVAQGGVNIHSKTKAIQAFERSPTPSVAEGMADVEREEEKSEAASPSPTVTKKRKRSDDPLEDVADAIDEERSVGASSAAAGSRSASPCVGNPRVDPAAAAAAAAAQIIAFTSDAGSSGMDLTTGTHLLCVDRWDQSSAPVREASHRIFKQLEGRVDRLTQATKPIIIRLVQDIPATWKPFVDSF